MHIMAAHARDISEGGLCLVGKIELKIGKMLDLRFTLPDTTDRIHAFGKVARSKKLSDHLYEMGITFWDIEEKSRAIVTDFLSRKDQ